jgi:hypothetical protein
LAKTYILHPHGESFGPFDLEFVRLKLATGAVAPTTGVTVVIDGVEGKYTSVAEVLAEADEQA